MVTIDLTDPAERQKAVAGGYIWSAPDGAIRAAFADIAAGKYPAPAYIPEEFRGEAEAAGIDVNAIGGMSEGSGPA